MRIHSTRPRHRTGTPAALRLPRVLRAECMTMTLQGGAMKKVGILPGVFLVALLLSGLGPFGLAGLAPSSARAESAGEGARSVAPSRAETPGDVAGAPATLTLPGAEAAAPLGASGTGASPPNQTLAGSCTFTALLNDNSTSGNERAPTLRNRFGRSVYLIKASELAANGLTSGSAVTGIGWNYQTAQNVTASTPLIVYLQNTSDVTNTKSTTWATAITGMTVVHNAATTLPSPAGA